VRPSALTINRLLDSLPLVLKFDGKCELLRKLRERHRKPEYHSLRVKADDWKEHVLPLVKAVIQKAYRANLPEAVERRLTWLSNGDMQTARALLAHSQVLESAVALSLLQDEMQNIETAISNLANFVNNADLMDQRKQDYQMSAEFEGASGVTKIQVGRHWSKTVVVGGTIGVLLLLILLYVLTRT
jgi:hypothetical protein